VVPTTVDEEVAKSQKPYEGAPFEITVEQMEPERLFSFRWHPFAVDPGVEYSLEPTTLVAFSLAETADGVLLNDHGVGVRSDSAGAPGEGVLGERGRLEHAGEVDRGVSCLKAVAPGPKAAPRERDNRGAPGHSVPCQTCLLRFSRRWAMRRACAWSHACVMTDRCPSRG